METIYAYAAIILLSGLFLGWVIAYLIYKSHISNINLGWEKTKSDSQGIILVLEEKLKSAEIQNYKTIQEKKDLNTAVHEKEKIIKSLSEEKTEFKIRLDEQNKNNQERLNEFNKNRKLMKIEFENLAGTILEEKSKRFSQQNIISLNDLLNPMREQLGDFRKRVDQIHNEDSKDRSTLQEQIIQLNTLNQQMNKEAKNLTRALTGDKKVQGNWGEMILEKVLEQSGLRKGVEYETQTGFRDPDNNLLKPDVIVHLPEGKDIIIDSKVSLINYNEYVNCEDEIQQQTALKAHVQSVSNHIKNLSSKDYSNLKELRSLDFILMFMPIDAAFMAAFQHDEQLFNTAFENKIIVVTSTTLLATLRTIENIWRYERQNENARKVADSAGLVYDKLRGFLEDFEKIGKQLNTVHTTYDTAMNKLTLGRGNLIRQAESFVELGVKIKKQLPKDIVERAEIKIDEVIVS